VVPVVTVYNAFIRWGGPGGLHEHQGAAAMQLGDIVHLRREVINVAGADHAILVENGQEPAQTCGRVDRGTAAVIAPLMDAGAVVLSAVLGTCNNPYAGRRVCITLQ
jgi:hypothetical protein